MVRTDKFSRMIRKIFKVSLHILKEESTFERTASFKQTIIDIIQFKIEVHFLKAYFDLDLRQFGQILQLRLHFQGRQPSKNVFFFFFSSL